LAHLYLLRALNSVPAYLVSLYFTGDREMKGPETEGEWREVLKLVKGAVGLGDRHRLAQYTVDVFIDVGEIEQLAKRRTSPSR
jgi:hypothetical protein